jgi:hypothetical protein
VTREDETSMSDRGDVASRSRDNDAVIVATSRWIERAVIGLNLCPFARVPFAQRRVHFHVSAASDERALLDDLRANLIALHRADPLVCETTLLIHPHALNDFFVYNDFLDDADAVVRELGLEGELQVASFHPDYQFADAAPDAIENFTNRSPYPMLHLLREASVERAVDAMDDTDNIPRRNIETLRRLGVDGWRSLMRDDERSA